jgi:hypothetical protein
MSETIKAQVLQELAYHRQETVRLQKILDLLEGGQGSVHPASKDGSVGTLQGTTLKVYKKRTQTPEARKRIGDST